jgi:peptidoglycan/xylan/chitin deacetylase (PgdA/CDA1 family)
MNVYLTFDIEVWCNGWDKLDSVFPGSFERYIFGHSTHGDYALPKTLEILNRHGLKGIFFVEPLFAARFGIEHLKTIVCLIRDAGQEIQLHIHPEWTDEITPPIIEDVSRKRQHLSYYTLEEQTALIAYAKELLERAGSGPISAFRAGSFAANADTFRALGQNGISYDSSLNRCYPISAPDLRQQHEFLSPFETGGVLCFPVTVFSDGFGKERPAQVGACSSGEICDVLLNAMRGGITDFVVLSHNFEMLKPNTAEPDWIVVRRFERLCRFLAENQATYPVVSFSRHPPIGVPLRELPKASLAATLRRHIEQIWRRLN